MPCTTSGNCKGSWHSNYSKQVTTVAIWLYLAIDTLPMLSKREVDLITEKVIKYFKKGTDVLKRDETRSQFDIIQYSSYYQFISTFLIKFLKFLELD